LLFIPYPRKIVGDVVLFSVDSAEPVLVTVIGSISDCGIKLLEAVEAKQNASATAVGVKLVVGVFTGRFGVVISRVYGNLLTAWTLTVPEVRSNATLFIKATAGFRITTGQRSTSDLARLPAFAFAEILHPMIVRSQLFDY
jgi:hypothetical protein